MIVYGYVKGVKFSGDGTMQIQVRIPNIHGAFEKANYGGKTIRNYTEDMEETMAVSRQITKEMTQRRLPIRVAQALLRVFAPLL